MIIVMKPEATKEQVEAVLVVIAKSGHNHCKSPLKSSLMISVDDRKGKLDSAFFKELDGVMSVLKLEVSISEGVKPPTDG